MGIIITVVVLIGTIAIIKTILEWIIRILYALGGATPDFVTRRRELRAAKQYDKRYSEANERMKGRQYMAARNRR